MGGNGYVFVYSIVSSKDRMELKPIVFFNDHTSFVTSVTCTRDGRLYTSGLDRLLCVFVASIRAVIFCNTLCMYDQTNDGTLQYKASKAVHDAGITSCVCEHYNLLFVQF